MPLPLHLGCYPRALGSDHGPLERVVRFVENEAAKHGGKTEKSCPGDEPTRKAIYWIALPKPEPAAILALGLPPFV